MAVSSMSKLSRAEFVEAAVQYTLADRFYGLADVSFTVVDDAPRNEISPRGEASEGMVSSRASRQPLTVKNKNAHSSGRTFYGNCNSGPLPSIARRLRKKP